MVDTFDRNFQFHIAHVSLASRADVMLVAPASADDIVSQLNLTGKKAVYTLAIPKGDKHNWLDRRVQFFGETWQTFGFPVKGIEENIPLDWNEKVMVEKYG